MSRRSSQRSLKSAPNARFCTLREWRDYEGYGFELAMLQDSPAIIEFIESNSPAAAGGLLMQDVILKVNNQDVSKNDYIVVMNAIIKAKRGQKSVTLLVMQRSLYMKSTDDEIETNIRNAQKLETPLERPNDYLKPVPNRPRTCEISTDVNGSFGFKIVRGRKEIGAYILEILPNSESSKTALRKNDRILEINDIFVDDEPTATIKERIDNSKVDRRIKLYVVDTHTYKHFSTERIPLESKKYSDYLSKRGSQQPLSSIQEEDFSDTTSADNSDASLYDADHHTVKMSSVYDKNDRQNGIRLCTAKLTNPNDQWGFELVPNSYDQSFVIKIIRGPNGEPSRVEEAGVRDGDYLIELNGVSTRNMKNSDLVEIMKRVDHRDSLRLLVADAKAFQDYKAQKESGHQDMPNMRKSTGSKSKSGNSIVASSQTATVVTRTSSQSKVTKVSPSSVLLNIVAPSKSQISYKLRKDSKFKNSGLVIESADEGLYRHTITGIIPGSPAEKEGLKVGQSITEINGETVQTMKRKDFEKVLKLAHKKDHNKDGFVRITVFDRSQDPDAISNPSSSSSTEMSEDDSTETEGNVDDPTDVSNDTDDQESLQDDVSVGNIRDSTSYTHSSRSNGTYYTKDTNHSESVKNSNHHTPSVLSTTSSHQIKQNLPKNSSFKNSGLTVKSVDEGGTKKHIISYVTPGSPAEEKGFRVGQSITAINNRNVQKLTGSEFERYLNLAFTNSNNNGSFVSIAVDMDNTKPANQIGKASAEKRSISRGTIDIIDLKSLKHKYFLHADSDDEDFGFELQTHKGAFVIRNIKPKSAADRADMTNDGVLIEINNKDVNGKSMEEVQMLIKKSLVDERKVQLFVESPTESSTTKRPAIIPTHDDNIVAQSMLERNNLLSSIRSYQSLIDLLADNASYERLCTTTNVNRTLPKPKDPWPRRCTILAVTSVSQCGFRITKQSDCDTPIIIELLPNSPAQKSGLTVGDHIIYIESENVQSFPTFKAAVQEIGRLYQLNGQIELTALTDQSYRVLNKRGGLIHDNIFIYESPNEHNIRPILFNLKLNNFDCDFGFELSLNVFWSIHSVRKYSSADSYGLKAGFVVLELNGRTSHSLSSSQVDDIIRFGVEEKRLDLLVIDEDGYRFMIEHGIPIHSQMSFVEKVDEIVTVMNENDDNESVLL